MFATNAMEWYEIILTVLVWLAGLWLLGKDWDVIDNKYSNKYYLK